jgi:hypothetical protein
MKSDRDKQKDKLLKRIQKDVGILRDLGYYFSDSFGYITLFDTQVEDFEKSKVGLLVEPPKRHTTAV